MKYFDQPEGYVEPKNGGDYGLGFDYYYQYKDHLGNIRLAYREDPLNSTRFQQEFEGTTGDWHTQANEVSVSNSGGRLDIAIRRVYFTSFKDVDVTPGEPVEVSFDFDKGGMGQVHVSIAEYKNGGWEPFDERDIFYSVQTGRFQTAMTPASDKIRVVIEKGDGADNGTFSTCHLDNLSVTQTALKVVDVKDYYPFGLEQKRLSSQESEYPYGYNGKELSQELGLNTYDFGARNYSPDLGRWMNIDPMADKNYSWTPFRYAYNNPLKFVDPDGLYERDGHYWTVYLAGMVSGRSDSGSIAYWAEEPDHVMSARGDVLLSTNTWMYPRNQRDWHALTGGNAVDERATSRGMFGRAGDAQQRGYALHRLGDSYAHSKSNGKCTLMGLDTRYKDTHQTK